ncbi:MAG TPA: response regulator [Allosphingosinicella sp.]|jgi:CheY-like chemotaxis protein
MWSPDPSRVALVVDDESFARLFTVQILLDQGFMVLEAGDAGEALQLLAANDDVALVVTDISMPGEIDGLGLAAQVRLLHPDIPVIVASGRVFPIRPEADGRSCFLAKPYTATALVEAIAGVTAASPVAADTKR